MGGRNPDEAALSGREGAEVGAELSGDLVEFVHE